MSAANMGDFVRQAGRMKKDMERVQEELKGRYVQAASGGDLVEATFNGQQEIVKLSIDPKFFGKVAGQVDVEMLEDLVTAVVTQGIEKSKALMKTEMEQVTGGLGGMIPGLF